MAGRPRKPTAPKPPAEKKPSTPKRTPSKATAAKSRRAKTVTAVVQATADDQQRENGDKRSEMQRLRDQAAIARLYLRGWLQKDIAIELNLSEATVSRDLAAIAEALEASAQEDVRIARSRELAKIDHLEREAWEAWEQSKKPQRTTVKTGAEGQAARGQIKERQRDGDPRYMQVVQWCIEERARIRGLYAPTKVAGTDPSGEQSAPLFSIMPVPVDYRNAIGPLRPPAAGDDDDGGEA